MMTPEDLPRELRQMQEQMSQLLEAVRRGGAADSLDAGSWQPPVDIYENALAVVIDLELAGLEQKTIDVHIAEGALVIQGERGRERSGEGWVCQRSERSYGPFRRTFLLPTGVDVEQIQASCERGVLTVVLPKQPAAAPRQIEVAVRG